MTSRLAQMQARFQQKQMEQKEEKLLRLYENQQQRAFERVGRGSAGSNTSIGSTGGGKVRQMFDERRQKAGVDRSYPLQPIKNSKTPNNNLGNNIDKNRNNKVLSTKTSVKTTSHKTVSVVKSSKTTEKRRDIAITSYGKGEETTHHIDNIDSHRDLIEIMNKQNLNNNLDDEEIPQLALDFNDSSTTEKDFSTNATNNLNKKQTRTNNYQKEESNPVVRRSVIKTVSSPTGKLISSNQKQTSNLSPTANKTNSHNMSSRAPPRKSATESARAPSTRAPSSSRPSAKQVPKSPVVRDDLQECKYCGRRFAGDRLAVHEDICAKTGKKKRKAYDATKHRLQGTELEPYVKKTTKSGTAKSSAKAPPKKDWRKTHEEFIASIKAAKMAQAHVAKGGKLSDLPPPPPSSNPDYVQCPHCGRRFNEAAAERHIPKCASYQFNKPKPGAPPKGRVQPGRK